MLFSELNLAEPILRAVTAEGYETPTPIQAQAIPHVMEGKDLLGVAQTGTGKTAAFTLPLLQRLMTAHPPHRPIRALILTPTRELAAQIGASIEAYGRHTGLRNTVIFGGVGQSAQERALKNGVDILVATPGRLLDLMQQGFVKLTALEVFILDEADRMLDMGFIHDVKKVIAALPKKRQSLFFSATMPPDIVALSKQILTDPVRVEVTPVSSTAEKVDQRVYFVEHQDKRRLLVHLLKHDATIERVIVFTRTKHGANRVVELLEKSGIESAAIHGNKSQNARERALGQFREGTLRVLVATDIAARGIDVEGVSHVVNFDLPNVPEQYVHRIGRTARAGASGIALSFCEQEERPYLRDIEKLTRQHVPVVTEHPFEVGAPLPPETPRPPRNAPKPTAPPRQRPAQGHPKHHDTGHARPNAAPHGHASKPASTHPGQAHAPNTARPNGGGGGRRGGGGGRPGGGGGRPGGGSGGGRPGGAGGGRPAGAGGGRPAGGGGRPHGGGGRPGGGRPGGGGGRSGGGPRG